jgi:hypothetical protein
MKIIMSSPDLVMRGGSIDHTIVNSLINLTNSNHVVTLISNRPQPWWFNQVFGATQIRFIKHIGRQNGEIVSSFAASMQLSSFDVIVLATKDEDIAMAKNGQAVLIGAGWSSSPRVTSLGIQVANPVDFEHVVHLTDSWQGGWWFTGAGNNYGVKALADLSSYGQNNIQQNFSMRLVATVKNGGPRLTALLAVTARSLLEDNITSTRDLLWGVYPSSRSLNNDSEVLSEFTHRLRTTVSSVRFAKRDEPLFIRHNVSVKRSANPGANRTDPCDQLNTIHLNPFYEEGSRLQGRNILVIDDCTTYGVSFGVAAAFLKKAGAASVTGIALGKFGNQLHHYRINLQTNPFRPIPNDAYSFTQPTVFHGNNYQGPQQSLQVLIA